MSVSSVLFSGLLVAFVVTMSHESEEILLEREPSFAKVCVWVMGRRAHVAARTASLRARTWAVLCTRHPFPSPTLTRPSVAPPPLLPQTQFRGTRDVICTDPVTEYLFGGMQYQLEHHLFPTMPRYHYRALVPRVKAWAAKHGIEYKADTLAVMTREHFQTLKRGAEVAAREVDVAADPYQFK